MRARAARAGSCRRRCHSRDLAADGSGTVEDVRRSRANCERASVPSAGAYSGLGGDAARASVWYGVSRVSAMLWQTAHETPCLPESVFRSRASTVANARPVPASDVGIEGGSSAPCSNPTACRCRRCAAARCRRSWSACGSENRTRRGASRAARWSTAPSPVSNARRARSLGTNGLCRARAVPSGGSGRRSRHRSRSGARKAGTRRARWGRATHSPSSTLSIRRRCAGDTTGIGPGARRLSSTPRTAAERTGPPLSRKAQPRESGRIARASGAKG